MRSWLLAVLALAASGCNTPLERFSSNVDEAKVTAVEESAARNGVRVHWVNYPRKSAESSTK